MKQQDNPQIKQFITMAKNTIFPLKNKATESKQFHNFVQYHDAQIERN